jgi:hypothetical protein
VKPLARFLSALLLVALTGALRADPPATPHFDAAKWGPSPQGVLGMPLGTFAVIEGTERATNKFVGTDDFVVAKVNGVKPPRPVTIQIEYGHLQRGTRYVLHGWEAGKWEGQASGLPANATEGWTQSAHFTFQHTFEISSVETTNGVLDLHAKPVDPTVPLPQPDFTKPLEEAPPVGVLGVPIGAFIDIKAHRPERVLMMQDLYVIDSVNGVAAPKDLYLTISNVKSQPGEVVSLHGYETAQWASEPELPKSEDPDIGREVQQGFQCFHSFRLIECK